MRVRAPNDSDQSRVVQMVIGDLHPSVVLTTANIHAPPSLEDTMNAMEPPARRWRRRRRRGAHLAAAAAGS